MVSTGKAPRAHGDTWIGKDGRIYVMVKLQSDEPARELLLPMSVSTGVDTTWLPPAVAAQFGSDLEIGVRTKDGRSSYWVRPELGPLNPLHGNEEGGGVLGMDVLSRVHATIDFKNGLVVS